MCLSLCKTLQNEERIEMWERIDKDQNINLYDRIMKQYEIQGITAALISATLGFLIDNKNIHSDYKTVYNVINGLGLIFSLNCVIISLIITSLIGAVQKKNLVKFLQIGKCFLILPIISIFFGISSMFICTTMYFGGLVSWIIFPFSLILYITSLIFYCRQRYYVVLWINE